MLKDTDKMPFGKYAGTQMIKVPASYLIWIYENDKCNSQVREYVKDNLDVLKFETKTKSK